MTLRLAIPKGRLQGNVLAALDRVPGLKCLGLDLLKSGFEGRSYHVRLADVEATLVKPRAIPQLVGLGYFDIGFCGLDILHESAVPKVVPLVDLTLNPVSIVVAVPQAKRDVLARPPRRPLVLATEYPNLANAWAFGRGLSCVVIETFGGTEAYVPEIADIVIDCVETGATLEANGLVAVETLFQSSTHAVVREDRLDLRNRIA